MFGSSRRRSGSSEIRPFRSAKAKRWLLVTTGAMTGLCPTLAYFAPPGLTAIFIGFSLISLGQLVSVWATPVKK